MSLQIVGSIHMSYCVATEPSLRVRRFTAGYLPYAISSAYLII